MEDRYNISISYDQKLMSEADALEYCRRTRLAEFLSKLNLDTCYVIRLSKMKSQVDSSELLFKTGYDIYIKEVDTLQVTLNTFSRDLLNIKKENFFKRIITSIKYIFKGRV